MRTGKQVSKRYQRIYKYAPIWTIKILNGVQGYSVEKAYAIDPLFGALVDRGVRLMQLKDEELEALRQTDESMTAWTYLIDVTRYWATELQKNIKLYEQGELDLIELDETYDKYNYWFYETVFFQEKTKIPGFVAKINRMLEVHDKYQGIVKTYDNAAWDNLSDEDIEALQGAEDYYSSQFDANDWSWTDESKGGFN